MQNHREVPALITVHDHIPVSSDGDIRVRLREASPAPDEQTDLGELLWTMELPPGAHAVVAHRFTVEHPAGVELKGL